MSYATPAEMRARFRSRDEDEFGLHSDAELQTALTAASRELDSYRPAGTLAPEGLLILAEKTLVLARMLVYQDQALGAEHPIVRDGQRILDWADKLARGELSLPAGSDASGGTGAAWNSTPTVWGRGPEAGL